MSTLSDSSNMPSESSFKKQVEVIRAAMLDFNTVRALGPSSTAVNNSIDALIKETIALNPFLTYFHTRDLFHEIVPAVYSLLLDFAAEYPEYPMAKKIEKVSVLNNHLSGSFSHVLARKSKFLLSFRLFLFLIYQSLILFLR